jgi:outer membrane protein, heavy metal efflux system
MVSSLPKRLRAALCRCAVFVSFSLCGCWASLPELETEAKILAATGVAGELRFDCEGQSEAGALLPGQTAHLGLEEAVRRAVLGDPVIQRSLARLRVALAAARQARTLPNPLLGLVVRWGPVRPVVEASLTESVVRILQTSRRVGVADHELRRASAEALTVALDLVVDLQEAYAEAQAADGMVPLLEARRELLGQMLAVAESRLRNGEGTQADVTTLDAQRIELEVDIASARQRQHQRRLRLARRIGDPAGAVEWELDAWRAPEILTGTESEWIEAALKHRPEIQALRWQLAALGDERAAAEWTPWQDASLGVDAQRTPDWWVGPSITIPLPLFDTGSAERERLTAEQAASRHELRGILRDVVEDVRVAFSAFSAQRDNLRRVRGQLIPAQQRRCEQAESSYRLGHADVTALLLSQQDLRAAQATALDLERETSIALVRLQRAVGGVEAQASVGKVSNETHEAQQGR